METLVTGHTSSLSKTFYQQLKKHTRLVVIGEESKSIAADEQMKMIPSAHWQEHLSQVFSSHSFDAVVYFLNELEEAGKKQEEVEDLIRVLDSCTVYRPKKVVVVSSSYTYRGRRDGDVEFHSPAFVQESRLLSMCDDLCDMYRDRYELPLTVLHVPYLFSANPGNSYISRKLKEMVLEGVVELDGFPDQTMDFLAQKDLAVLIGRILLEQQKDIAKLDVPGKARLTVQELAEVLRSKWPSVTIRFSGKELFLGPPANSQAAYQEYQWSPEVDIRDEMDRMLVKLQKHLQNRHVPFKVRWQNFRERYPFLFIGLEMVVGYYLMQYLSAWAATLVPFRTLDFRLLFVVIFASVHGHRAGILAAILAEFALFMEYQAVGLDWRILFYNVENWIPFIIYLIVGAVLGYVRDQNRIQQAALKEENEDLEGRYLLLNDRYDDLLANKVEVEKQIISSQENFGRLFYTLNKLEQAETTNFFPEALHALEDLLGSNTISFYRVAENPGSAHRIVSSASILNQAPQKLQLDGDRKFMQTLRRNEVWVNRTRQPGYPDFVYPIHHNGQLELLISMHEVPFEQMNAYQESLFKVAGSLINASLQRYWSSEEGEEAATTLPQIVELEAAAMKQPAERKGKFRRT